MRSHLMRTTLQVDDVMQAALACRALSTFSAPAAIALVVALDRLGLPDPAAVRSGLALSLFRSGSIPVLEGDAADLQVDLAALLAEVGEA